MATTSRDPRGLLGLSTDADPAEVEAQYEELQGFLDLRKVPMVLRPWALRQRILVDEAYAAAIGETDASKEALKQTIAALKRMFPAVPSAYKPSGIVSPTGVRGLLVATPIIALVTAGICLALSNGVDEVLYRAPGSTAVWDLAASFLIADAFIAVVSIVLPAWLLAQVGRLLKSRNTRIPDRLAALISIPLTVALFGPFWDGKFLVDTEIPFLDIPVNWAFFVLATLFSLRSFGLAGKYVGDQKYCEETGLYLRSLYRVFLGIGATDLVTQPSQLGSSDTSKVVDAFVPFLLPGHQPGNLIHSVVYDYLPFLLPRHQKRDLTHLDVVLWGHEAARTAYLEASFVFNEKPVGKKSDREKERWLIVSRRLDGLEMEQWTRVMRDLSQQVRTREPRQASPSRG